ncbi:hypothetical protein GCM10009706_09360 [Curtobacterium citreum]|nr:hypothetical protein GCM10009706_09360 [Curtobacterium citreum]
MLAPVLVLVLVLVPVLVPVLMPVLVEQKTSGPRARPDVFCSTDAPDATDRRAGGAWRGGTVPPGRQPAACRAARPPARPANQRAATRRLRLAPGHLALP